VGLRAEWRKGGREEEAKAEAEAEEIWVNA